MKLAVTIFSTLILTGCAYWYVPSQPHEAISFESSSRDSIGMEITQVSRQTQVSDLIGAYVYPRTGWWAGYTLELYESRKFSESTYSDLPTKVKIFRGSYYLRNDTLELHYRKLFNNDFEFKVINVDSIIFLIPFTKLDTFYVSYRGIRDNIIKANKPARSDSTLIDRELKRLKYNTMNDIGFFKIE